MTPRPVGDTARKLVDGLVRKAWAVDGVTPYGACDFCGGPLGVSGRCLMAGVDEPCPHDELVCSHAERFHYPLSDPSAPGHGCTECDELDTVLRVAELVRRCEWFALCDHEAVGTSPHPVLGDVPVCLRCARKHGLLVVTS